ncbi:MAG: adenylate/guanylate cyclase domain-containing protein [Myxococcota bacterium]
MSIQSRLILMVLGIAAACILVVATVAYRTGSGALKESAFDQLTSLRAAKADQLESYFRRIESHVETLGENTMVANAMVRFGEAFAAPDATGLPEGWKEDVRRYYRSAFLPHLAQNVEGQPVLENYLPSDPTALQLQYHYLSQNPHEVGEKQLLTDAGDGSAYSAVHAEYHPRFRKLLDEFGYYDLFLVDLDSGAIVYSVYKEVDFATGLLDGPYENSNLAEAIQTVRAACDRGLVTFVDFAPYRPSYGAPAAFAATPIFQGTRCVGILAVQIPVAEMNRIMTGDGQWQRDGLGESGETYLVGSDFLMRSISRFLVEDPESYAGALRDAGYPEYRVQKILQLGTSILQQEVRSDAAIAASEGKAGTRMVKDYRGIPVLSSYGPIQFPNLSWTILSEKDVDEAYAPADSFTRRIFVWAGVLMLGVTVLAMWLAARFLRPLQTLIAGARAAGEDDGAAEIPVRTRDEFGELARSFNSLLAQIHSQADGLRQRDEENERLLGMLVPAAVAQRLRAGEQAIADAFNKVTVLFLELGGLSELGAALAPQESAAALNELVCAFDDAGAQYGVERIETIGASTLAASGLSTPRLDHTRCAIDFALEAQKIVRRFNNEHDAKLTLGVAIASGPVVAGVVGREKLGYEVWGSTVDAAVAILAATPAGEVRVSAAVREEMADLYAFDASPEAAGSGAPPSWILRQRAEAPASAAGEGD